MMFKRAMGASYLLASTLLLLVALTRCAHAQDLLRRVQPQQQQAQAQQLNPNANPLVNIRLPPELASLTPAQLHQLAHLRELQLQQQAQQQQQQRPSTPVESSASNAPTAPPTGVQNGAQIPQPNTAVSSAAAAAASSTRNVAPAASNNENNERHDDGAYTESGSEMEGVAQSGASSGGSSSSNAAAASQDGAAASNAPAANNAAAGQQGSQGPAPAQAPSFEVNWNKCPQLEPSETEKSKKTQVITKCLQSAPIPTNLTRENVEAHREQIATCALRVEGWFDDAGNYKYDKAESEIRAKKLEPPIELQVLKFHVACKDEAGKKFPREQNKLIDQVQFYQACMDYYISIVCEIEVSVDQ